MSSSLKIHFTKNYNKTEKLAFLRKRYKKLILDPRKEIKTEIEKDLNEEDNIDTLSVNSLCQ